MESPRFLTPDYCATKHPIEAYSEALRLEVEVFNIRVSTVAPGTVSTRAGDEAMHPDHPIIDYEEVRKANTDKYFRAIRNGMDPERVAETILQIIRSNDPNPRYTVGTHSAVVSAIKNLLPTRLFEAGVRRVTKTTPAEG